MATTEILELFLYPVKSLAGVRVDNITFGSFGPHSDRRYMLVDHKHRMLTQRSHPVLSQFTLTMSESGWHVKGPAGGGVLIESDSASDTVINTSVWKTPIRTRENSKAVSRWFSEQLDELVYLVEFDDLETRTRLHKGHQAPFAFADGYPLLVCNKSSLIALNNALGTNLDISRFRANVLVAMPAWHEFNVEKLEHQREGELLLAEPCVRCNVPGIDPLTGVYQRDLHQRMKEALRRDEKVVFGMNAIVSQLAELRVGDQLSFKEP